MARRRRSQRKPPPSGISPAVLRQLVENTVPFILAPEFEPLPDEPHLAAFRGVVPDCRPDTAEYYRLCLSAHHATVTSFVPTDVDNAIRLKLWHLMPLDQVEVAVSTVLESGHWSSARVSTRTLFGPLGPLSGHHGEWFSTAAAAFGRCLKDLPDLAQTIADAVLDELIREARWFDQAVTEHDGLLALRVATSIAHNLGDLDRVLDEWGCAESGPLAVAYKLGHTPASDSTLRRLYHAGEVNKALMAIENHRHFALRVPRCLRRKAEWLLPIAPFLDDWGATLAADPDLTADELTEVVTALIDGYERLKGPVGYARALRGIEEAYAGGLNQLCRPLPSRKAKALRTGELRTAIGEPQDRFELRMAEAVWKTLDGLAVANHT